MCSFFAFFLLIPCREETTSLSLFCPINESSPNIAIFVNSLRLATVHLCPFETSLNPTGGAAQWRQGGKDGCDILLCLATLCIVLLTFMILGVGRCADECDGKLREVDTSSFAFVRTLYIRLHDTSLRKWRPASASAHLH